MDHVGSEEDTTFIILAHAESPALVSSKSLALHKIADTTLIAHALRKAKASSWNSIIIVANARNVESIEKVAKEIAPDQVMIAECSETATTMHALMEGLGCMEDDLEGYVLVFPLNMPLLETEDTLASMEAMLLLEASNAQVPYVGLLNKSATKHPPVFCADAQWLLSLSKFLQLPREAQDDKEGEQWIRSMRKAIGTHYLDNQSKILIRLCTVGYAVCAARDTDMITVDTRAELALAERVQQERLIKKHQAAGVTFRDPPGTFLSMDAEIGIDTEIGVSVQIYGKSKIAPNCRIEGPSLIRDCILNEGVYVRSHSVLEGAVVGRNAGTGPFARLREGTSLGPDSYLGNFVETKNTSIGRNTLVCHLSYLGDAQVGSRTNVGAGTITCNFNGHAKNRTQIGDDAFVGSNSTLIAPLKVGNEAVIAAGSVITEDIPDKAVCFGRARQVVKAEYAPTLRNRLRERSAV